MRLPAVRPGTSDLVVRLEEGLSVRGRLLDADGKPVPGAQLMFGSAEPGRNLSSGWAMTDAHGRFVASGLDDGRYQVRLWHATRRTMIDLGTLAAGADGVEPMLPR